VELHGNVSWYVGLPHRQKKVGDYLEYKPDYAACAHEADLGYVQPYTDSPLDDEALGENIYLGMIEAAQNYVWITTPYLIIDEQMTEALCRAVKSGVDVRIVTPGIPDKKLVNETTKSYYPILIENGVKIYEYKPGFIHAKTFLCDDRLATVGSVNLDYRSLYLHFECGVWLYNAECIADIKKDFFEIFDVSEQIRKSKNSLFRQLFRGVLELIAPLL
jgi:cardiolipin synthase